MDGIGPKQALKILGGIGAEDLKRALDAEDLARLESIPGLGKKTAQKLVFSLKGKLPSLSSPGSNVQEPHADIIRALAEMGYDRKRAADIIRQLVAEGGNVPGKGGERERELFRRAIVELSGS